MNEDLKKDFIKEVHAAAKSRYSVDVFADMVRAMAIAIEVPTHLGSVDALEAEYARIRDRYEPAEFEHFYRAFSIVMQALERHREDFLGHALAVGGLVEAERQREVVSKTETTTVGNAAALREAVVALLDALDSLGCDESTATLAAFVPDMADSSARCLAAFRKAKAALAAPARNCDLFGGDPKMLNTAWFDWTASPSGHDANGAAKMTFAGWLLAPAAERKGEDYGK